MPGLERAIKDVLRAKGLSPAAVAERMAGDRSKPTFYRLLTGQVTSPRLDTVVRLCELLQVSPTELLEMAGLWKFRHRSTDPLDIQLRKLVGDIQRLPADGKRLAVRQVESLLPSWKLLGQPKSRPRGAS